MTDEEVKVERAEEPLPVRFVSNHEFFRNLARKVGKSISDYIPRVAVPISPYKFAARHVFYALLTVPLFIAAVPLGLLIHRGFTLLLAMPLLAVTVPWLRLKTMIGDRKRGVDEELPFFAIHAAIAQSAGLNLYESLCSTLGRDVFEQIERGASQVKRNCKALGMSPMKAIEDLAGNHPHKGMKTLLLGYTSEARSGGDVGSFLKDKAESFLRRARRRWEGYLDSVSTITEVVLVCLFVFPILVLMASFLAPGAANALGMGFVSIGIPILMAICVGAIRWSQPKEYTNYEGNFYLPILAVPLTFLLGFSFFSMWIAISLAASMGFLTYGLPVVFQRRRTSKEVEPLPQFLRDVTEYLKLNYSLNKTVAILWKEGEYTDDFKDLLGLTVKQLKMGRKFSDIDLPTRSWLTRMAFFQLGQVAESGGVSPRSMELLTDFVSRVKEARDEARSSLKFYRFLAILVPFVLAFIVGLMGGVLGSIQVAEGAGAVGGEAIGQEMFSTPKALDEIARSIVLFSSIGVGFLTSYAADFTVKNTVWTALNTFLAGIGIALIPYLSEISASFLGF